MKLTVFCPECRQLILEESLCPQCGWQRLSEGDGPGAEIWHTHLAQKLIKPHCYPVAGAGSLHLGTEDGTLVALDLELGHVVWQRHLGNYGIASTLAIHQDQLFVACQDMRAIPAPKKSLLAVDAASGEDIWKYRTTAYSLSGPTVADGMLYFTTTNGQLHALNAVSGEKQWTVEHNPWGPAAPAAGDGIVCAGGQGGALTAYAATDGTRLWSFIADGWFATRPCIETGCVYALGWHDYLYALDAHTGRLLWKFKGDCGEAPTTPPLVAEGRVFVGSQVHQDLEAGQKTAYAVLALNAEDGVELWRYFSRDLVFAPLTVTHNVLFFSSNDGSFYAVDASRGETHWLIAGKSRIVTEPQVNGDIVCLGRRDGSIHAIRWRAKPPKKLLAPVMYEQRGEFSSAAAAYALQGEFDKAAALLEEQLGMHHQSAQLYERAGRLERAALLWEELGVWDRARDLYGKAGDKASLARVLETMGDLLEAACVYRSIGQHAKAAGLYEHGGDWSSAADLYHRMGQLDKARAIWKLHNEWERLAGSLVAERKLAEAAVIFERQGRLKDAAKLYEEAEQLEQALRLRVELQDWGNAARLADRTGNYVQKAVALERLGHNKFAAQAYEQAAQHLADAGPQDEAHVAALYQRAAEQYEQVHDGQCAYACRRQAKRYRHLPEVHVHGEAQSMFTEYEWNSLVLRVENTGFGPAFNIRIGLRGKFDVRGKKQIRTLLPEKAHVLELFVRSRKQQVGPKVPLEIVATYKDSQGNLYGVNQYLAVHVVEKGAFREQVTPVQVHLHGDLIRLGSKAQAGDRQSKETALHQAVHLTTIRDLLLAAFTAEDLRRVLFYASNEALRPLLYEFGPGDSLVSLIDATIAYCTKRELFADLLSEVEKANPKQYARFIPNKNVPTDSADQEHDRDPR